MSPKLSRLKVEDLTTTNKAMACCLRLANWPLQARRVRYPDSLPQSGRVFMAAFELEHHPFNVLVVLMRSEELQAFLWIAPFQDLDALLARAP